MVALVISLTLAFAGHDRLAVLESRAEAAQSLPYNQRLKVGSEINSELDGLISNDELKTGEDFRRAANAYTARDPSDFRVVQAKYECTLVAVALGDAPARDLLAKRWDEFQIASGRPLRLETIDWRHIPRLPSPKSILDNFTQLERSPGELDHPEMRKIMEEDQSDREKMMNSQTFDPSLAGQIAKNDDIRIRRTKELLESGALKSANDFWNASLVFQHGKFFDSYLIAHELAVCSLLLGNQKSAWLCGATYDRMLNNSGRPQRFVTQYQTSPTGEYELAWYDTNRINDSMRKATSGVTLQQAIDRAKDFLTVVSC